MGDLALCPILPSLVASPLSKFSIYSISTGQDDYGMVMTALRTDCAKTREE